LEAEGEMIKTKTKFPFQTLRIFQEIFLPMKLSYSMLIYMLNKHSSSEILLPSVSMLQLRNREMLMAIEGLLSSFSCSFFP
jgi:hypothetical protein